MSDDGDGASHPRAEVSKNPPGEMAADLAERGIGSLIHRSTERFGGPDPAPAPPGGPLSRPARRMNPSSGPLARRKK